MTDLPEDVAEREKAAKLLMDIQAAKKAYADNPVELIATHSGECVRCQATNIPITPDDEIVEDAETGEVWLRAAIGLAPRGEVVEDADEDEDELEPV